MKKVQITHYSPKNGLKGTIDDGAVKATVQQPHLTASIDNPSPKASMEDFYVNVTYNPRPVDPGDVHDKFKYIEDTVTIYETIDRTRTKAPVESTAVDEALSAFFEKVFNEVTPLLETVSTNPGKAASDEVQAQEFFGKNVGKSPTDTANTVETNSKGISKPFLESATPADAVRLSPGKGFNELVQQPEAMFFVVSAKRQDVATTAETVGKHVSRSVFDTVTLTDAIGYVSALMVFQSPSEGTSINEKMAFAASKGINEAPPAVDLLSMSFTRAPFLDSAIPQDYLAFGYGRWFADTASLTETIVRGIGKRPTDVLTQPEAVVSHKQNYFAGDYVSQDYTGTSQVLI